MKACSPPSYTAVNTGLWERSITSFQLWTWKMFVYPLGPRNIYGYKRTGDSVHPWRLYSAAPLEGQAADTETWYPSHIIQILC